MTDLQQAKAVATTILHQLGGNKLIAMTGARNFVSSSNSLGFKLPSRSAKNGINFVLVTLNSMDTYDVKFKKIWNMKITEISSHEGIYDDMLQPLFVEETGLNIVLY